MIRQPCRSGKILQFMDSDARAALRSRRELRPQPNLDSDEPLNNEEYFRLWFSCRWRRITRIREGPVAVTVAGWPVHVRDGIQHRNKNEPPPLEADIKEFRARARPQP